MVAVQAQIREAPALDRRGSPRHTLSLKVDALVDGASQSAVVHDLSETGFLIHTPAALLPGERIEVELPEAGPTSATVVWKQNRWHGCEFASPVSRAALSAARLKSAFSVVPEAPLAQAPSALQDLDQAPSRDQGLLFAALIASLIVAASFVLVLFQLAT